MTAHATLGASSAHRWMRCPGSVALTRDLPDTGTAYSREGVIAHELAELCLRNGWTVEDLPTDGDWSRYPEEMREYVQLYIDYVRARLAETGGQLLVEIRVDFSQWVPGGFGTADAIILAQDRIIVIDLKYGQGVRVSACDNEQAQLYALGAYSDYWYELDEVKAVESVIVQPRLDHIDEAVEELSDLLAFGERAGAAAHRALSDDAPLVPGDPQCRFCTARGACRARAEYNVALAEQEFSEPMPHPGRLSVEELAGLLPRLDELTGWAQDVKDYALRAALGGTHIPGYKVVAGRSSRKWRPDALSVLLEHEQADALIEKKPVGIGQAEKVLGKSSDLIQRLTEKPDGKPTLAPANDKRPEIQGAQSAANDFDDDDDDAAKL